MRYRWLFQYARRHALALAGIYLLTFISVATTALTPWPMKLLLDGVQTGGRPRVIWLAAGATLGIFALGAVLDALQSLAWTLVGQRMVFDLGADLFARMQRLSPLFHSRNSTGDCLSRINGDSWCVYTVLQSLMFSPVQYALTLLTVGAVAWQLDPALTLISLVVAPVMAGAVVFFGPRLKRRAKLQRQSESQLVSFVHQTLSSIPLVQTFSMQSRNVDQFRELAGGAIALSQKAVVLNSGYNIFTGLVTSAGLAVVTFIGAQRVLTGAMTLGSLVVFLAYLRTLHGAAQGLLTTHSTLKTQQASVDRIHEILQNRQFVEERADARPFIKPEGTRGIRIDLDQVTFGYESGQEILKGIDLHMAPGQVFALVGATGAGKSTLTSVIPRLMEAWSGTVRLGGCDVREMTLRSVREAVAFVPQESLLLPVSIEQNIAFGTPDASQDEIRRAADAAGASEFIERLPEGWQTVIGERGSTLSAGQRQRIAIARALLKDAPVLILDEPTSNLDARTEHAVMEAMHRLMEGRTCLLIAHRLSTIRRADQIVLMEDGRIVEQGSHEALLALGGGYARLWNMQHLGAGGGE